MGTLVIPNTVALVKGGPNPDAGRMLIDYLLSAQVEDSLAHTRSIQIPLNPSVVPPDNVPILEKIVTMDVTFEEIADKMEAAAEFVQKEFVR